MKKLPAFIALLIALTFMACTRNGSNNVDTFTTTNPPAGKYKVTYYIDEGNDKTASFSGYTFEFVAGGNFIATGSGNSFTGSWSETSSKLIISLPVTTNPLKEIDDDWLKEEKTPNTIKLKDDSKEERLHFTRL